jgi:hypothetical protein
MAKEKKSANLPLTPLTGKPGPAPYAPQRMKKRLTTEEEFDILKMVLDKILWLGFGIMALGLWELYRTVENPFALMFAGAVILIIFIVIIVREYEIVKR